MQRPYHLRLHPLVASIAAALALIPAGSVSAAPPGCTVDGTTMVCEGDQSAGINVNAPPSELQLKDIDGDITPAAQQRGVSLTASGGAAAFVTSGESGAPFQIRTDRAEGIFAASHGQPSTAPADDPLLGVPDIGSPGGGGGVVRIDNHADVHTDGNYAIAISAASSSGYSDTVVARLRAFTESGFSFAVTEVRDAVGGPVAFAGDTATLRGHLIDDDGEAVLDGSGNRIEHGTFQIGRDGSFSVTYTQAELDLHDLLAADGRLRTAVDYDVDISKGSASATDSGRLIVNIARDEDSVLVRSASAYFDSYGFSAKPDADTAPTLFPDLKRHVDDLLALATSGGLGGSATVVSDGNISTSGDYADGIRTSSRGGTGARGGDGSIGHSASAGGRGKDAGASSVTADGSISTSGDYAAGIVAASLGGTGGNGGDGGHWRHGAKGGTGGTGGTVTVRGSADIVTTGDYAAGIIAVSTGGNGGDGGSGSGAMPGGLGGYGGMGGEVVVDGTWKVSTGVPTPAGAAPGVHGSGIGAHGIWAKSVGGNAGAGGSGGWLFGRPGGGGDPSDGGDVTLRSGGEILTRQNYAYGLYAQSVGGFGAPGGTTWGLLWSYAGDSSSGGSGGEVFARNLLGGSVTTEGLASHALYAQSVGGGGGAGAHPGFALVVSLGGDGAAGGDGGTVTAENAGALTTRGNFAHGLFAQSVGGGGGDGASSSGLVALGGTGSATSNGGEVWVSNLGSIDTYGIHAHAIFAESVGGGGGNGGSSSGMVSIGGSGGAGGDGKAVHVSNAGSLHTRGISSYGILAQSVGGGGGNGGSATSTNSKVKVAIGGSGGTGGIGEYVEVVTAADSVIITDGERANALLAQSVGGGGGNGGYAITANVGGGASAGISLGGEGGSGNIGGTVKVDLAGSITTNGNDAYGVFAQSVGGGGGSGGLAVSGDILGGASLNLAFGGDGGVGGAGGTVEVGTVARPTAGTITTHGERAYGVLAQSVGGGGGAGGMSTTGSLLSPITVSFGSGGAGATGGLGDAVDVHSASRIVTHGQMSHGIFAQSVGGGGGAGGTSISGNVTAFGGFTLAMGGSGGVGNTGGTVTVNNSGTIETFEQYAYGIFAQSVGGGGGAGGSSGTVMANFSSLVPIPEPYPTISVNIAGSIGGDGGSGGLGGRVDIDNSGRIATAADFSHGVFAQSVGGGGGDGGKSIAVTANISLPSAPSGQISIAVDFAMAIGGDGGSGNHGGEVDVDNAGAIDTTGIGAHGILAQSVGGGGGMGGDARSMILSIDPSNWSPVDPPPDPTSFSAGATLSIGGQGGSSGDGRLVDVLNSGTIITRGADAYGILAQSVGGGGGIGGGGYHGLDWQDFGVPEEYEPFLDLLPVQDEGDVHITIGGKGGSSGSGGNVRIDSTGFIGTAGAGSVAVFAQSVGGGGGIGGTGATGGGGSVGLGGDGGSAGNGGEVDVRIAGSIETLGAAAYGIVAQSIGGGGGFGANIDRGIDDFGWNFALGASGGSAGNGGTVTVDSTGDIVTRGAAAVGIFAQSVGGGGGLAGEIGLGFGFSGTVGGKGAGGAVTLDHSGNILTFGEAAHGIVAQSAGGGGGVLHGVNYLGHAGAVAVTTDGHIRAAGSNADGIVVQSLGGDGNSDLTVTVAGGSVTGGTGSGAGIRFLDGAANTLANHGLVRALSDLAVSGGTQAETVNNHGIVQGNVDLGGGLNAFNNLAGGRFDSGAQVALGAGRSLSNSGTFAPGGIGTAQTTNLTGDYVQAAAGVLALDLSLAGAQSDLLATSGVARVGGKLALRPIHVGHARPGAQTYLVMTATGGIVDEGVAVDSSTSAVLRYSMAFRSATEMEVSTRLDFNTPGLNPNATRMATYVTAIQTAGGTSAFAPYVAGLIAQADEAALAAAYEQLGSGALDALPGTAATATVAFNDAMHSCRQREGSNRFAAEGECSWLRIGAGERDQDRTSSNAGYDLRSHGVAGGVQKALKGMDYLGFGLEYQQSKLNSTFSDVDGERLEAGLIFKRVDGQTRMSASLSLGYGTYDSKRTIDMAATGIVARADQTMWNLSAHGRISHDILHGQDFYLRPMFGLGLSRVLREGFDEKGAGGANLQVKSATDTYFTAHPAIEFGRELALEDGTLARPYLRLGITRHLNGNRRETTATMEGAPAGLAPFTSVSKADSTYADVVLGIDMLSRRGTVLRFDYTGQFWKSSSANAFWVKYSMPF